jgi:hypothetical protein
LTVDQPAAALPLAFLSHFALDAIPHYDPPGDTNDEMLNSKSFFQIQLLLNGTLCIALVVILAITQPKNWLMVAVCAFLGAAPDIMWLPMYLSVKRTGHDNTRHYWLLRFHGWIQWMTSPRLLWVELVWLVVIGALLVTHLA